MKFLLPQQIYKKSNGTIYKVSPGNAEFIKLARKKGLILEETKISNGEHIITESYSILENDYKRVLQEFKQKIELKRKKFYDRPLLEQVILLLKYIFIRNRKAKEVRKYSAICNAYDDKSEFLKLALNIAPNIQNEHFSYGYQLDPGTKNNKIIYYFQVDEKQVSFHAHYLYPEVPEFQGTWIGHRNEKFPFTLREIKGLVNK